MLSGAARYMPSLPEPIICCTSLMTRSCLLPMESSVQRMSCRVWRTARPSGVSTVARSPSALTTSPPREYSSAVKCQPPWFWAL
ncbi:hypothetical protein SFUMM280S_04801 [Streptomyces fumanus]